MRRLALILAAGVLLAGCVGTRTGSTLGGSTPVPVGNLPGLPLNETPAPRLPTALKQVTITGATFYEKSPNATVAGDALSLAPGAQPLSWAIYRLPDIGTDYAPQSARVVAGEPGGYWVAVADYARGKWSFFTPQVDAEVIVGFDSGWESLRSPAGHLYMAVVSDTPAHHASIVFTVDEQPLPSFAVAQGGWARAGGGVENGGFIDTVCGLTLTEVRTFAQLGDGGFGPNRTSPVIRPDGSVAALSRGGVLRCYNADLSVELWSFDPRNAPTGGQNYACPPQTPCVDAQGNVYYVAVHVDSIIPQGVVWAVSASGDYLWDFGLGPLEDVNDKPYPSLNISKDVMLAVGGDITHDYDLTIRIGIDAQGNEVWRDGNFGTVWQAEAAVGDSGNFEMPVTSVGPGAGNRLHWAVIEPLDGSYLTSSDYPGLPENLFGGVALPGNLHVYPDRHSANPTLFLMDAVTGETHSSIGPYPVPESPTARSADGRFVFQTTVKDIGAGVAALYCAEVIPGDPPELVEVFHANIESGRQSTCRIAIDASHTIYGVLDNGTFFRLEFDPEAPIEDGLNPALSKISIGNGRTYHLNNFALGPGVAYIICEQEELICWTAPAG